MAFSQKSQLGPEDFYRIKVVEYMDRTAQIEDGERKYLAVINGEAFMHHILEGSNYYESKKKLMDKVKERNQTEEKMRYSSLNKANALLKLQQREARKANVYGERGVILVPKREIANAAEATEKVIAILEEEQSESSPGI
jgi:hypothetical protein